MVLYSKLRDWTDDDPKFIAKLATDDTDFSKICGAIFRVQTKLKDAERSQPELYASPVNPNFIRAWRDYEQRYSRPVGAVQLAELFDADVEVVIANFSKSDPTETHWEAAAARGASSARGIGWIFHLAETQLESMRDFMDEDAVSEVEDGISEWESLEKEADLDLEGIVRRRELIPFVLIPRHVSRPYGNLEKLSLFDHLRDAQRAFIFGTFLAAIALMRSLLELLLRDHYGARGTNLDDYVRQVSGLPQSVRRTTLHSLRRLANDVIHFNKSNAIIPANLEKELVGYLLMLRDLIEYAPTNPVR